MSESWKKDGEEVKGEESLASMKEAEVHGHSLQESLERNDELAFEPEFVELLDSLRSDRQRVEGKMALNSESDLDSRLDLALSNGYTSGRRRSVSARRKRISLRTGIAAISLMLLLTAFVRISPTFAAIVKDIPGFGRFVELVSYDSSLKTALDHEYFQLVNQSDEKNGYKFTVNGVLADSERIVLLYTAEGPGITEEDTTFLAYKLKDQNGADLQAMSSSAHFFRDATQREGVLQDYLDIRFAPGETIPQELGVMMQLGDEWLEVKVPIDHEKFAELEETQELNETIEVAGQRITITKVRITPLQVTVDFKEDPLNTKELIDLIDVRLIDDKGRSYTSSTGMGSLENSMRKYYQLNSFQKIKSLTLVATGVFMNDRNMKVVIDTEKKQLISAPDERLSLGEVIQWEDGVDLKFELLLDAPAPGASYGGFMLFEYGGLFRDASGNSYQINYGDTHGQNYVAIRVSEEHTGFYYFHIPNEDYVQPLTLDVKQYYGYALQDISVRIK
ncbi:DUF4179 domain-containing protein [Paenibacillus paeoniae]|uniref:DUF4179 domain-containing protein n=1 Tax=Paenibacillus paeoniae TaxID=2292705 RepID=A0A371PDZ9_9BACL|nr:DUF4179 domain-containing protein [Paenibacillus paeoniae]REK74134.1 DUF4179 domain-containing protein [Paenibacillus paeoniae]